MSAIMKDETVNKYRKQFVFHSMPHIQSTSKMRVKQQRAEKDPCNREPEQGSMPCLALGIENLFSVKCGATVVKIL